MKLANQSGGQASRKIPGPAKAGLENPAHSEHVENGHSFRPSMPVAALAGSFSRKIPGPEKAGQEVAGKALKVSESFVRGRKITKGTSGKGPQLC